MLISLYDIKPSGEYGLGADKYGFVVPVTYEAVNAMVRDHLTDLPDGHLVDILIDGEREIAILKYRCTPTPGLRIAQAGEYPHRGTL